MHTVLLSFHPTQSNPIYPFLFQVLKSCELLRARLCFARMWFGFDEWGHHLSNTIVPPCPDRHSKNKTMFLVSVASNGDRWQCHFSPFKRFVHLLFSPVWLLLIWSSSRQGYCLPDGGNSRLTGTAEGSGVANVKLDRSAPVDGLSLWIDEKQVKEFSGFPIKEWFGFLPLARSFYAPLCPLVFLARFVSRPLQTSFQPFLPIVFVLFAAPAFARFTSYSFFRFA